MIKSCIWIRLLALPFQIREEFNGFEFIVITNDVGKILSTFKVSYFFYYTKYY